MILFIHYTMDAVNRVREKRLALQVSGIFKWCTSVLCRALALCLLAGCSTKQVTIHAAGNTPPLCRSGMLPSNALVLWGTAWRANQKEPILRNQIAGRAIAQFFASNHCFRPVRFEEFSNGRPVIELSDIELLKIASASSQPIDSIVSVRIEEMGPLLIIYPGPILWEGGSEAMLRIRILNARSSRLETDVVVHSRDTGAFVIRGAGSLDRDVTAALTSVFGPWNPAAE